MRARIKNIEDMPDYVKCCKMAYILIPNSSGTIIDVDIKNTTKQINNCPYCNTAYPKVLCFRLSNNKCIPCDCVDIDEGA